jgi:hypothetical protein
MATTDGTEMAVNPFHERVGKLLGEFVGKPVTSGLVNELTSRVSKQSGVTSVISEQTGSGIKLMVNHVEGVFHWLINETVTLIKHKI